MKIKQTILNHYTAVTSESLVSKHGYWTTIPKKNGKLRKIWVAPTKTPDGSTDQTIRDYKKIRELFKEIDNELSQFPTHKNAIAYKTGVDYTKELQGINRFQYFYKFDFKDFFDSFTLKAALPKVIKLGINQKIVPDLFVHWNKFSSSVDSIKIVQGHPSSPKFTNVMLNEFDEKLTARLEATGNIMYKRYCDDIIIATNTIWRIPELTAIINNILKTTGLGFLKLNKEKTKAMKIGGQIYFLGLSISKQGVGLGWRKRKTAINLAKRHYDRNGDANPEYLTKHNKQWFLSKEKSTSKTVNMDKIDGIISYANHISTKKIFKGVKQCHITSYQS